MNALGSFPTAFYHVPWSDNFYIFYSISLVLICFSWMCIGNMWQHRQHFQFHNPFCASWGYGLEGQRVKTRCCILKNDPKWQNTTKTQWPMAFASYPRRSAVNPEPSNRARRATRRAVSSSCLAGRRDATAAVPHRQKEPGGACDLQNIMHQDVG